MKLIHLNGKPIELPGTISCVQDLLQLYELEKRIVVVEVNKEIIFKEQYREQTLSDRDTVEIVHFVGGG